MLVFVIEKKASPRQMEKQKEEIGFLQGLIVPRGGKSSGLALMWKEDADVNVHSYSNSHIDVVLFDANTNKTWRVIGFYRHPQCSKITRLLDALRSPKYSPRPSLGGIWGLQ